MSSCRPILVISRGAYSSDLERAKLQPEYKHYLHGSRALTSASRRAVHRPAVVASLPEPCVSWFPLSRTHLLQAAGRHSSPLPSTLIEKHCRRRFPGQVVARRQRPVSFLGAFCHVVRQVPYNGRTTSAAASGVPGTKLVGSPPLRGLSNVLLNNASFPSTSSSTSASAIGAAFAWTTMWQLLSPALVSSVRSQVVRSIAAVQSFAVLVRDYCLCPRAHPVSQHGRSSHQSVQCTAMSAFLQPVGPGTAWPCASPVSLVGRFRCGLLQSRVHRSQQQPMSVPQPRFASSAVRALVSSICKAARMLHEVHLIRGTHRVRLQCCASAAKCTRAIHHRARQPNESASHARTYARALSTHLSQPMPLASQPSSRLSLRLCPGVNPSLSACSVPS